MDTDPAALSPVVVTVSLLVVKLDVVVVRGDVVDEVVLVVGEVVVIPVVVVTVWACTTISIISTMQLSVRLRQSMLWLIVDLGSMGAGNSALYPTVNWLIDWVGA